MGEWRFRVGITGPATLPDHEETSMDELVQLTSISVSGLFGLFNHTVDMRTSDRVTILHGPNGIGKTVILRLIHAFFHGRNELFLETSFRTFSIHLSNESAVTISRPLTSTGAEDVKRVLEIVSSSPNHAAHRWSRDRTQLRRMAEYIDSEVPYVTRTGEEQWSDDRTGESYSVSDLVHKFQEVLPDKLKVGLVADPDWLKSFRESISVHLVETQRLLLADVDPDVRRFRPRPIPRRAFASTVKTYSSNLRAKMADALTSYAEHSQALDRSFPQRMLGGPKTETLDTNNLKSRMNQLEQRRSQLKRIGLIEDDTSYPFDINTLDSATPMQKAVMTLYVEDTENKLGVLDNLEEKVDLLLGNINRKFRPNKQLRAERNAGLVVRDKRSLRIDLDSLSSGEQHELVLIYGLLFQVKPGSLVLIDEPELSLHVTWQKAFLTELFAIIKAVGFDVLIATHSPFIVSDRVDLMVPLAMEEIEPDAAQNSSEQNALAL